MADLSDFLREHPEPPTFEARPWYNRPGDCLEFHFIEKPYHAERIDNFITVYRADDTRELIGFKIKGVRHLLKKYVNADRD